MDASVAERLETGELIRLAPCPVAAPQGDDLQFLLRQRYQAGQCKYISYVPQTGQVHGLVVESAAAERRLADMLRAFSEQATLWLGRLIPEYAHDWRPQHVTWRTEEEAIRCLEQTARNDLLHVDVPSPPSNGARLLRLFVNVDPSDTRVWATAESFAELLHRFGTCVGLPSQERSWGWRLRQSLLNLFSAAAGANGAYDRFMVRLHQFLKTNDDYQEKARRHLWRFQPGEAWLAFTDGLAHAELRGRFALEQSFQVPLHVLARPELAPATLLEKANGAPMPRAA
jgi:hypothetical protein